MSESYETTSVERELHDERACAEQNGDCACYEPRTVPPIVDGLAPGESVTILGTTYTAPGADDGPGRDQHGPHDKRIYDVAQAHEQALLVESLGRKLAETRQRMESLDPRQIISLPAPRTAPYDVRLKLGALLVEHRGGDGTDTAGFIDRILAVLGGHVDVPPRAELELEVRVKSTMYEHRQGYTSARTGARQIIRLVREANPRAYSDRVTLPAEHVEAGWQVLDARDEETWRDVAEVVDCADPNCTSTAGIGDPDVSCIVLVGAAWAEGYTHLPTSDHIDVRIPAATA